MKTLSIVLLSSLLCISAAPAVTPTARVQSKLAGDYVEARTASVFAGACHYNGELVTSGRDAVMAWNITAGAWNQTDLSGVKAMAVVTSPANLIDDSAARKSEVVIDAATDAQVVAMTDLLKSRSGASLGEIVKVSRATVTFSHDGAAYAASVAGFANISAQAMPNDECCKQPSMVWYTPLAPLTGRKVGFTLDAGYVGGTLGDPWERAGENSAFYGALAF